MVVVESAGISDVGKKRKGNEDSLYLNEEIGLYLVADGMGGHAAGEVASELVVETISGYIKDASQGETTKGDGSLSMEANRLLAGIHLANRAVHQVAQSNEAYQGMGSTVSAALITDSTLIAANVGDSPIYLVHNSAIEQLSVTHNVVSEQEAIDPTAAERLGEEVKYLLTRAMGIEEKVKPDVCEIPIFPGDIVVMNSDGLSDLVTPEEILEVVQKEEAERACQILIDMANRRGGHDNITVIVLKIIHIKRKGALGRLRSRMVQGLIRFLEKFA